MNDTRSRLVTPDIGLAWLKSRKGLADLRAPEVIHRPAEMNGLVIDYEAERLKSVLFMNQGFSQRSGKPADKILSNLFWWWQQHPEILDPRNARENGRLFAQFVREVDPQSRKKTKFREIAWWADLARRLREDYNSDARHFFYYPKDNHAQSFLDQVLAADMDRWEEVSALRNRFIKHCTTLTGVKLKVASLIAIFFQDTEWHDQSEFWERFRRIPFIPFDMHHIREVEMMGLVHHYEGEPISVTRGDREYVGPLMSHYFSRLCYELKVPHHAFAQTLFNTGATIHRDWNRKKKDAFAQALICHDRCPIAAHCRQIVPPAATLNTKKRQRSEIGTAIRMLGNKDQQPLFKGFGPTKKELLKRREELGSETRDRGSLWGNTTERPESPIIGTLFDDI